VLTFRHKPEEVRKTQLSILIGVMLLLAVPGFAQSKKQEAYRNYKEKSATSNVSDLLSEANLQKNNNPAAALETVQEALAISVADGNEANQAKCYLLLGEINEKISAWTLAKENYLKAYQLLNREPDSKKISSKVFSGGSTDKLIALKGLGNTSLQLKLYDDALRYFEEGISLSSGKQREEFELAKSEVQYQSGNYEQANQTLDQLSDKDDELRTVKDNQRAKVNTRLNTSKPSTSNIFENSLNTVRSGGNVPAQTNESLNQTKDEIASTFRGRQQYDEEIDLRKNSIEYNLENKNLAEVTKDKVEISKTLEAKGETDAAIREMEEAIRIVDTLDNPKEKANAFLTLANLYDKNGRNTQAIKAYKKYSEAVSEYDERTQLQLAERDKLIGKQDDIVELTNYVMEGKQEDALQEAVINRQQLIIYGLSVIIVLIGGAAYFIFRSSQAKQMANQLLALKSLRSQMNPHFIFNALNSVNHFIAQQDERTANKFLSDFSLLMRLVLENSEQDFISLSQEQEMLALYLKLEHYRFRDKFDYEFTIEPGINSDAVELPPMLIQPYIENAVWHGLRYKEGRGLLSVQIAQNSIEIEVKISDNGIGRKKSAEIKTANQRKHNSTGLKNIRERLSIINKVYRANYRVEIDDLPDDAGTTVRIYLPIANVKTA
jgi:tetratricopeptide (TPR) repeat protein